MNRIDEITERRREEIEAKIRRIYSKAATETADKNARFYARLKEKSAKKLEKVNAGEITMEEFQEWLQRQMVTGKINEDHMAALATRLTDANTTAAAYVNGETPSILAENYNWSAYGFETTYGNLSFSLYDEDTVRRLIAEDPDILPPVSVDVPIDERWNRDKIRDEIISAILQGKSIPEIADSIRSVAKMDEAAGIRNARTAITGAQNAGRQASYERAAAMGIQVTKRWMAAMDGRTRDSHRHMDGVEVPYNKPFVTPLGSVMMYPGDINGKAGDVYNCRCTMRTVEKPGIEAETRTRRVRDPHTGKNVVISSMTYREWERWKKSQNILKNAAGNVIIPVKKVTLTGPANRITEYTNKKGAKDRNYYDDSGNQYLQISNTDHGHKAESDFGYHGEHAHDYFVTENGKIIHGKARELTETERKENADFL